MYFQSANCTQNQVSFGPQNCPITDCSSTWIQCQTSSAYIDYAVNNSASDPCLCVIFFVLILCLLMWGFNKDYGPGYAWSKPLLEINVGDTVTWSWRPPSGINTVVYQVVQVEDENSFISSGFRSGFATAVGSFQHQFNQAGTYYYWSGYVESSYQITFRGIVIVSSSNEDKQLELSVSLNGFTAQKCSFPFTYNSTVYENCTDVDLGYSWCSPTSNYSGQSLRCDPISKIFY